MPRPSPVERARAYVSKMPQAISGSQGHNATFAAACAIVKGFQIPEGDARVLLAEYNSRCDPKWSEAEIEHKLQSALNSPDGDQGQGYLLGDAAERPEQPTNSAKPAYRPAPKVEFDPKALEEFSAPWAKKVDLIWLANRSETDPATLCTESFLGQLYGSHENVLIFDNDKTQGQALWPHDIEIPATGKNGVWFLAQPVDGQTYPNPRTRKNSRRSEESVTSWRWMLLESDDAPLRQWLGAIVQMPLRIGALYTSGGRSVHALIRIDAHTKKHWDQIKEKMAPGLRYLMLNGADRGVLSAVRLTRLPGAYREGSFDKNGNYKRYPQPRLQKLLYVNSKPEARPLVDIFAQRDVEQSWMDHHEKSRADQGGNDWIDKPLNYYAPVSERIRHALTP